MKPAREEGFALLMVFLMAAVIAINMYMQLPRAAFEAQRGREELLQQRGEEYIRAIQLYVTKWKRYPPDLDALEKTNNVRYLRKRYRDPMTGKDEWRAIHINAAGQLTDSLIQKQPTEEKKQYQNNFITELPTIGSTGAASGDANQNPALRRRPSDEGGGPMPGGADLSMSSHGVAPGGMQAGSQFGMQPGMQPNAQQPAPGQNPQQNPQPGQLDANGQPIVPGQQPGQPEQPNPFGQVGGQMAGQQPGQPPPPPAPGQQQANSQGLPYPVPAPPGAAPNQNPPAPGQSQQAGGQGLDMINKILTTPRSATGMQAPGAPGLQIGGGLAGFASMSETPSIKIYNERQKYNEWEFIYDMKKDKRLMGAAGAVPNQQGNPLGGRNPGMSNPGMSNPGMSTPGAPNPMMGAPSGNTPKPITSFGGGQAR